ncbi:J domain-containing protein [Pontibacter sp. G13]|uniref:J domain-containing protein n=1 Tax=Pontibacter sp. G13 TaxID=3074898 RepID=UPI002889C30E|nr:J domain-containing protein [Pontibacter sp. G13]WNJ17464.1 J domain-containing protein [Pontibacter sp. G13]
MFQDHYEILGISRNATSSEIKEAYRELAKRLHPDQNDNPDSHERFLAISKSYQILNDSTRKAKYDLAYDRHHGEGGSKTQGSQAALEITRSKRASRYRRTMYSQRVKYRGHSGNFSPEFAKESQARRAASRAQAEIHERYARQAYEQVSRSQYAFINLAKVLQVFSGLLLLFTIGLWLDQALAVKVDAEVVISNDEIPRSVHSLSVNRIATATTQLELRRDMAERLFIGSEVHLEKTLFSRVPTGLYFHNGYRELYSPVAGGRYGPGFRWIYLVMIGCLAVLLFRKNPEFNAYLGVIVGVLSTILLSLILTQ